MDSKNKENTNNFIINVGERISRVHPNGIGYELYEAMLAHRDKIAQIDSETGLQETYGALLKRSVRAAIEMRLRGITSEDMVTLCSDNHMNSAVPFIASLFLNVKISCLDPTLSASDTAYLLEKVRPKMIFTNSEAESLIEEGLRNSTFTPQVVSFGHGGKYVSFVNFIKPSPQEENFLPVPAKDLKDTIVVLFSSGTTGLPKGICLHHYALQHQCNYFSGIEDAENFIVMLFASLYWISTVSGVIACALVGCKRLVVSKYDRKSVYDIVNVFKPTGTIMAPTLILDFVKDGVPKGIDCSSLNAIAVGGSSISGEQLRYVKGQLPGAKIFQSFGMTETAGVIFMFNITDPDDMEVCERKPTSCGKPIRGILNKIVDPETNETLGPNQRGELRIKSDFLLNGYYNQDSSGILDEEGWLKTGDIMYYDEDKCFYHVDRIKEMLKYKSWHVVPTELEGVIARHPDVLDAVVVGIPHPEDGDHPCGVVVLKENAKVTPDELRKFADDQLEERKKLRGGVKFVKEFPVTPTGKIRRVDVRNLVISGRI